MSIHPVVKYVAGASAAVIVSALALFAGCSPTQSEGGRCNPTLASGETDCNSGLACTQPPLCPENYCCPVDSKGYPAPSTNPFCQTGCSGGAASMCNAGVDDAGECAFACTSDPSDLASTAVCSGVPDGGAGDSGGGDAPSDTGAIDAGGKDAAGDTGAVDAGGTDAAGDADISDGGAG